MLSWLWGAFHLGLNSAVTLARFDDGFLVCSWRTARIMDVTIVTRHFFSVLGMYFLRKARLFRSAHSQALRNRLTVELPVSVHTLGILVPTGADPTRPSVHLKPPSPTLIHANIQNQNRF